jgi:hypothetical protein
LQAFVFFIFKLLQNFVTSCASQFVRFFLSLWICKIDCVFFLFFRFKVFVFYLWSSWFLRSFMCCWVLWLVQELLAYSYHGILKFLVHLSPPLFLFHGSFSFVDFLLLKGSRLLSITTCVNIVATFLNLTCLYVLSTWASYFVEESFIKNREGGEGVWAKGNKVNF